MSYAVDWDFYYHLIDAEGYDEETALEMSSRRDSGAAARQYVEDCYWQGIDPFEGDIDDPFPDEW